MIAGTHSPSIDLVLAVPAAVPSPDRLGGLLRDAADAGVDLVVLPELYLTARTGGGITAPGTAHDGLACDDPLLVALARKAAAAGQALLFGYEERCTGESYSAAQLIDAHGHAIANARSRAIAASLAPRGLTEGRWQTIVPFGGYRLGLLIGDDIGDPAAAMLLAELACDFLICLAHRPVDVALLHERASGCGLPILCLSHDRDAVGISSVLVARDGELQENALGPQGLRLWRLAMPEYDLRDRQRLERVLGIDHPRLTRAR